MKIIITTVDGYSYPFNCEGLTDTPQALRLIDTDMSPSSQMFGKEIWAVDTAADSFEDISGIYLNVDLEGIAINASGGLDLQFKKLAPVQGI